MKLFKTLGLLALLAFSVPAIGQDTTSVEPPKSAFVQVDTIDSYQVGDSTYYLIAQTLNGVLVNVKKVAESIQAAPPQNAGDWLILLVKLFISGVLTSILTGAFRAYNQIKEFVTKLPKGEWIVFLVSTLIGGAWYWFETKFVAFDFVTLFFRVAGVFLIAVLAWRSGLSKLFQKKEAAPNPQP